MIHFDEETHTYTVGGRRIPSVTEILKPLYSDLRFVAADLLEYKSEIGKAVHKAIELHTRGELDYGSLVEPVLSYFRQYLAFEATTGFIPVHSEVRVYSVLGYCGTLDLIGHLDDRLVLIDIKTTAALSPAVALQTAAYQTAYNAKHAPADQAQERYALRLTQDKYRLQPYRNNASDFGAFVGFLKAYQWMNANSKTIEAYNYV